MIFCRIEIKDTERDMSCSAFIALSQGDMVLPANEFAARITEPTRQRFLQRYQPEFKDMGL